MLMVGMPMVGTEEMVGLVDLVAGYTAAHPISIVVPLHAI
jgi:hypothetical protein